MPIRLTGVLYVTMFVLCAYEGRAANINDFVDVSGEIPGRLYIPPEAGDGLRPLVVYLHGGLHAGTDNVAHINSLMDELLDDVKERGAYLYAPQSPNNWQVGWRSSHEVMTMLNHIVAKTNVDPQRVYVSGLSMGGGGTWDMLNNSESRFAAALPIASDILQPNLDPASFDPVPTWAFHARDDGTAQVKNSRDLIDGLLEAAQEPRPTFPSTRDRETTFEHFNEQLELRYTEFPSGGHSIWDKVWSTSEVMDWMFLQACSDCVYEAPAPLPAIDVSLGGESYSQDFDQALGGDERDTSVALPPGWSITSNNIYNHQTVNERFRQRARPTEGAIYNAGAEDDADRALATGVTRKDIGNEVQLRAAMRGGDATQVRLRFDLEAWSAGSGEGSEGEVAFHTSAEVSADGEITEALELGRVGVGPMIVPEGRTIDGNSPGFRSSFDSGWRNVDVKESSTLLLRWIADTEVESTNWVFGLDNVQLEFGLLGDVDRDGVFTSRDVDLVGTEVWNPSAANDRSYDLTDDGIINRDDVTLLLQLADRVNGDATFDGRVELDDFLRLSENFGSQGASWSDGDFDSNGQVDFPDFLILSGNFGMQSSGAGVGAVPEPSGWASLALGLLLSFRFKRLQAAV